MIQMQQGYEKEFSLPSKYHELLKTFYQVFLAWNQIYLKLVLFMLYET
jgi:hypothetical protein